MQIVSQLELQLSKEKTRLEGMMKHLQLEQTKSGELKKLAVPQNDSAVTPSHLQMLQSSVDRASENIKLDDKPDSEMTSRMAAMAAMFPNLPTSITASLAFPSTQSLPSPLSALNAAVQRSSAGSLIDRPASLHSTSGNALSSTPIRPKPPVSQTPTTATSSSLTPIAESRLLPLPPGDYFRRSERVYEASFLKLTRGLVEQLCCAKCQKIV